MRRIHQLVAAFVVAGSPVVFHDSADARPFGMPEHQTRTGLLVQGEQVEFLPELAVIPLLGLFQALEVFVELLSVGIRHPVNALQHGAR